MDGPGDSAGKLDAPPSPPNLDLPYPEYSVLEDGAQGTFLPQLGGQAGADKVYRGWASRALEPDENASTSLLAVLEHLQSTFTPLPGIPTIEHPSELLPYLPTSQAETPSGVRDTTTTTNHINDDTIRGYKLRQPSFEEMSDVWKSVGMSLLRWALAAFERDRADSQGQDEGLQVAGSSSSQDRGSSRKYDADGMDTPAAGTSAAPSSEENGQDHQDGIPPLPDSAFTITIPTSLPFPEICVRRNLDVERTPVVPYPRPQHMKEEPADTQKTRKKALYAEQKFGIEGSKTIALTWLNAVMVCDPGEERYTRLDSVFHLYRAYAYHPFRCPVLDQEAFEEVLFEGARTGMSLWKEDDLVGSLSGDAGCEDCGKGDASETLPPTNGNDRPQANGRAGPHPRPRIIRGTIRPPDKVIQKAHEAIWESIGLNWKKARGYNWAESEIIKARERERAEKQKERERRVEAKRRVGMANQGNAIPVPGMGTGTGMGRTLDVLRQVEVRPRGLPVIPPPSTPPPDFVTLWLSRNYRPCPPGRSTPQKELWQAYTLLVQSHSTSYSLQLERYSTARLRATSRTEWEALGREGQRLGLVHRALCHYIALRPAEVFELVIRMFGGALRRMEDGSYGLDGLERVRTEMT